MSCNCKCTCSTECNIPITLPTGPTGATGAQGPAGTNGTNGTNGTLTLEHYASSTLDFLWPGVATTITDVSHTLTGENGEYMMIADILTVISSDASGEIQIFVNGGLVDTITPINHTISTDVVEVLTIPLSINWKGTVNTGQVIEIKVRDLGSTGGGGLRSIKIQWQIYKVG